MLAVYAGVPIILILRASRPQRMPWWLVVVLSAALCWIILNIVAYLETRVIEEQFGPGLINVMRFTNPPKALRWGWLIGLEYLALCLGPYWLIRTAAKRLPNNRWRGP
jgi:hypothetical protein